MRLNALAALVFGVTMACSGCHSPSQYTSPRVTGRVLDEETKRPIKGVQVRRTSDAPRPMEPPKGSEIMMQEPSVFTRDDGTFTLQSQRDLSFLRQLEWFSVSLSFNHPDYVPLKKTFSSTSVTNKSPGEPLVETGDVLLKARK
jgi:hypothetical protein